MWAEVVKFSEVKALLGGETADQGSPKDPATEGGAVFFLSKRDWSTSFSQKAESGGGFPNSRVMLEACDNGWSPCKGPLTA